MSDVVDVVSVDNERRSDDDDLSKCCRWTRRKRNAMIIKKIRMRMMMTTGGGKEREDEDADDVDAEMDERWMRRTSFYRISEKLISQNEKERESGIYFSCAS